MIGLQKQCGVANLPGLVKIEFADIRNIEKAQQIIVGHRWMEHISFLPGYNWEKASFLPTPKNSWLETHERTQQGSAYRQSLTGVLPGLSEEIAEKITQMQDAQFILRLEDITGRPWILGTLDTPFDFSASLQTNGVKGHRITFSARTLRKAFAFIPAW